MIRFLFLLFLLINCSMSQLLARVYSTIRDESIWPLFFVIAFNWKYLFLHSLRPARAKLFISGFAIFFFYLFVCSNDNKSVIIWYEPWDGALFCFVFVSCESIEQFFSVSSAFMHFAQHVYSFKYNLLTEK